MPSFLAPKTDFDRPSLIYSFLSAPITCTARTLYHIILLLRRKAVPPTSPIRVVCLSDTHTHKTNIPDGDVLIHAGDLTNAGTLRELQEQIHWLESLPHAYKIAIAGNHDTYLDPRSRKTLYAPDREGSLEWGTIHYLQHDSITITIPGCNNRKLKIYGAPQIPACGGKEFAFQYPRHRDAWSDTIPIDTDILVTHTPLRWHLDLPVGLGCEWLLRESWRVRPKLHVFGHVHAGYGSKVIWWDECQAAYERICARSKAGSGLVSPGNWIDMARLCTFGFQSVVWSVLWGGEAQSGMVVNSALMSQETGKLVHAPQIVHI